MPIAGKKPAKEASAKSRRPNRSGSRLKYLCGGFTESSLRHAGCIEIFPGPAALFARFGNSLLAR